MGELWHLRPELEFSDLVDSWNVRAGPDFEAPVVNVLRAGQAFTVLQRAGDWLQVRGVEEQGGGGGGAALAGWSYTKLEDVDALVPISHGASTLLTEAAPQQPAQPAPMVRTKSCEQRVFGLLTELGDRRRALEQASAAAAAAEEGSEEGLLQQRRRGTSSCSGEIVRRASEVQDTMARLELLGVEREQLLALEGAEALAARTSELTSRLRQELRRKASFDHSDFANPEADSCWLSTFFQSLWHSRVFHALFDRLVRPLPPHEEGTVTKALRETWELYEGATSKGVRVPVRALVQAWGSGYGDCAEAFGGLQGEAALRPLADQLALVAVPFSGATLTPDVLWTSVQEAGVSGAPLLALDLMLPPMLPSASILTIALALMPRRRPQPRRTSQEAKAEEPPADLGEEHRLVAAICYMDQFAHYVVFCRRQSEAGHWRLFNDIEGVAHGALRDLHSWAEVAHECARHELRPKVLFYESLAAAERAVANASPQLQASIAAAAASQPSETGGGNGGIGMISGRQLFHGLLGAALVAVLALILQQVLEIRRLMA